MFQSSIASCDKLYSKEDREKVVCSPTTQDLDSFYSPLGEPDLWDLPSFAYQISQGMVIISAAKCTPDQRM